MSIIYNVYSFDLCKTKSMISNVSNQSNMLISILQKEGMKSLYKGLYVNIGRQIPLNLIRFGLLEMFKTRYNSKQI